MTLVANIIYAVLLAVVVVFAVIYISAIFQTSGLRSSDGQYRMLAATVMATQSRAQVTMAAVQAGLAQIAASRAAVEKLMIPVQ